VSLEWIVVDAGLWHDPRRRERLIAAIDGRIDHVLHVPPKPCRWQGPARLTKSDYFALANARNTGLVVAAGERVAFVDDCSVLDESWLARHLSWPGYGVAGSYCTYQFATVARGRIVAGEVGPYGWDPRRATHPTPGRTNGGWAFGLNHSYPLDAALRANGYDEMYDGQAGSEDCDAGIRFERAGCPFVWDPECVVNHILETHAGVFGPASAGRPKELRIRRDGQMHFANEVLAERLVFDEPNRSAPLGNSFSLVELRIAQRTSGAIRHPPLSTTDWRDGQPLSEMGDWRQHVFDYTEARALYQAISTESGRMVLEAEGLALYRAAHECGPESILIEIGSYKGTSTAMLARGMAQGSILFAIDPHEGHVDTTSPSRGEVSSIEALWRTLRQARVEHRVAIVPATSRAAHDLVEHTLVQRQPGLLFVDGSHLAEDVYLDLRQYAGRVREGGFIVLDDIGYDTVRAGFERWRAGAFELEPVDLRAWGLEDPAHNRLREGAVGKMTFFRRRL
jgi:predicted O-methyltransferase YrrM